MRFAARPVGVHSSISTSFALRICKIEFTMVVLPVPGPPVMTRTFELRASCTPCLWLLANVKPVFTSIQGMALPASMAGQAGFPRANVESRSPMAFSA
jgi:hypothetical protein